MEATTNLQNFNLEEEMRIGRIYGAFWAVLEVCIWFHDASGQMGVDTPFYNFHLTDIQGKTVILHQGHDHNFNC